MNVPFYPFCINLRENRGRRRDRGARPWTSAVRRRDRLAAGVPRAIEVDQALASRAQGRDAGELLLDEQGNDVGKHPGMIVQVLPSWLCVALLLFALAQSSQGRFRLVRQPSILSGKLLQQFSGFHGANLLQRLHGTRGPQVLPR